MNNTPNSNKDENYVHEYSNGNIDDDGGISIHPKQLVSPLFEKKKLGNQISQVKSERINNIYKNKSSMYTDSSVPNEKSFHDSDIQNCNWIFLEKARGMVQDCKDLDISFQESENEVILLLARIHQNVD